VCLLQFGVLLQLGGLWEAVPNRRWGERERTSVAAFSLWWCGGGAQGELKHDFVEPWGPQ
jgi:hypothetical protein